MNPDHDRIEELLAGYALRALDGVDALEADRLLLDHVPECPDCRTTLEAFEGIAGDLALAADPAPVPDLLMPSIRRQAAGGRRPRRSIAAWLAAAAMVGVLALSGWNFLLNARVDNSEQRREGLSNMINTLMREDGSRMLTLEDGGTTASAVPESPAPESPAPESPAPAPRMMVSFQPGAPHGWVLGMDVPQPAPGHVYQLWLGHAGLYTPSERFIPDEVGSVRVFVPWDLSQFDEVRVTEEAAQIVVVQPATVVRWYAIVSPAEATPPPAP